MWLLLVEMLLALLIIVFIMWWTMKGADAAHPTTSNDTHKSDKNKITKQVI
jgi:beta-lactam-binding protein with PASTA domain